MCLQGGTGAIIKLSKNLLLCGDGLISLSILFQAKKDRDFYILTNKNVGFGPIITPLAFHEGDVLTVISFISLKLGVYITETCLLFLKVVHFHSIPLIFIFKILLLSSSERFINLQLHKGSLALLSQLPWEPPS